MNNEQINAASKLGMRLGGLPRRVADKEKQVEIEKRIRTMLYPVRNAQNAEALMKAIAEAQKGVDRLSERTLFFPIGNKKDGAAKMPQKEHLWVDANLLAYLAGPNCEWEKVKHLVVVTAYNMLNLLTAETKDNNGEGVSSHV